MRQPLSAEPVVKLQASAPIRPGTVTGGSSRSGITAEGVPSAILTAHACSGGSRHARRPFQLPNVAAPPLRAEGLPPFHGAPRASLRGWAQAFRSAQNPGHQGRHGTPPLPPTHAAPGPRCRAVAPGHANASATRDGRIRPLFMPVAHRAAARQAPGHPSLLTVRFPDSQRSRPRPHRPVCNPSV